MAGVVQQELLVLAKHGLIWRADHDFSLASAASMYIGFVIGENDMLAMTRSYWTLSTHIDVDLFRASFTGGTPMRTLNRRLELGTTPPIQLLHSVTPGALGDSVTGFDVQSTGPQRIGREGDSEPFIHEAGASYVLRITNAAGGTHPFAFAIDYREKQPGEY